MKLPLSLFYSFCFCLLSYTSFAQSPTNRDTMDCNTTVLNISTGVNHSTGNLYPIDDPASAQDGFWSLELAPDDPPVNPGPAWVIEPNPAWTNTMPLSSTWISAFNDDELNDNNDPPALPYRFERCFCVAEDDSITFDFRVYADDQVADILLDLNPLLPQPPPYSIGSTAHFKIGIPVFETRFLEAGKHCLAIDVRNRRSRAMGLMLTGDIRGANLLTSTCCDSTGSICGFKYNDINQNGEWDPPVNGIAVDERLANWPIIIDGPNGLEYQFTDPNGNYCFNDLPSGSYEVSELMLPGWTQSEPGDPDFLYPSEYLAPNQVWSNINFGNYQEGPRDPCDLMITQECEDTCTRFTVTGADWYEWLPPVGVNGVNSSNPLICGNLRETYLVIGYSGDRICAVEEVTVDSCFNCDEFYAVASCATCSCGGLTGRVTIYHADGTVADPNEINITWTLNGQIYESNSTNPLIYHYDGPRLFTAHISYSPGGNFICDTLISAEVVCEDDCPDFQIATCYDEIVQQNYPEYCEENDLCSGAGGYLFILDGAGNLIDDDFYIDWFQDNHSDTNPYYLDGSYIYDFGCETIPVEVRNFSGCNEVLYYEPDCCSQSPPHIACAAGGVVEGQQIWWDKECGNEFYEVEIYCLSIWQYGYTETYTVTPPDGDNQIIFTIPTIECTEFAIRVRGFCSSTETYGDWSNCLIVYEGGCYDGGEECEYIYGEEDGGSRNADIDFAQPDRRIIGKEMQLYPNPANDKKVYLRLSEQTIEQYDNVLLIIRNVNGSIIMQQQLAADADTKSIDLLKVVSGVYFVSIQTEQGKLIESKSLLIHQKDK